MLDKFEGTWKFRPSTGIASYRTWVIDDQGNVVVRKGRETAPGKGTITITAADGEAAIANITTHGSRTVRDRYRLTQRRDGAWEMRDARTGDPAGDLMYS